MAPSEFLRNYYSVTKFMVIAPLVIQWQYLCERRCFAELWWYMKQFYLIDFGIQGLVRSITGEVFCAWLQRRSIPHLIQPWSGQVTLKKKLYFSETKIKQITTAQYNIILQ